MKHTIYSQNKFECQTKGAFIPTMLTLHPDKSVIFSANEKGLIQCWDIALNPIYLSLSAEADFNMGGSNILDIGHNFNRIPIGLCDMKWYEKSKFNPTFMETMAFNYLCLRFHNGPLALMRFSGGVMSSSGSFGPIQLIVEHLKHNNYHAALLFMNQMDWPTQGESILIGINKLFHRLFRQAELTKENESLMEMGLGLFYAPNRPIPEETMDEFSEQVHDIARKFFHRLLRHGQVGKAFKLAVDINDYDLFMDIHHYACKKSMQDLADAALIKAQSTFANNEDPLQLNHESSHESSEDEDGDDDDEQQLRIEALQVSSLPRPIKTTLPGPMQLFSSTINASATPAIAVLDQPSSMESFMSMQPQLSAVYLRTTAAKRISTTEYQTKAEIATPPMISPAAASVTSTQYPESLASLPRGMAEQATKMENPEDIKVIHFGVV